MAIFSAVVVALIHQYNHILSLNHYYYYLHFFLYINSPPKSYIHVLVGGFNPSEKYESQLGFLFPIYGKINFMFQITNQCFNKSGLLKSKVGAPRSMRSFYPSPSLLVEPLMLNPPPFLLKQNPFFGSFGFVCKQGTQNRGIPRFQTHSRHISHYIPTMYQLFISLISRLIFLISLKVLLMKPTQLW